MHPFNNSLLYAAYLDGDIRYLDWSSGTYVDSLWAHFYSYVYHFTVSESENRVAAISSSLIATVLYDGKGEMLVSTG